LRTTVNNLKKYASKNNIENNKDLTIITKMAGPLNVQIVDLSVDSQQLKI
jgi:hypothetical protein